jgi:hypothetical protein
MFIPQLGVETQAQNNGGSLSSYTVEIVYWGPNWYWTQVKMNQYTAATGKLLSDGYLNGVMQYGSNGSASLYSQTVADTNPLPDTVDRDEVEDQMDLLNQQGNALQTGRPTLYLFATPAGLSQGFSSRGSVGHNWVGNDVPIIWNGNTDTVDDFTFTSSHELDESFSDPGGNGFEVHPGPWDFGPNVNGQDQIGDYEPVDKGFYRFRMGDGIEAQPYWSRQDQAFIIGDGNPWHQFWITPIYNGGYFSGQYNVTILGDQTGSPDDFYTIATTSTHGQTELSIMANGESVLFDQGTVNNIMIGAGGGNNTLSIEGMPFGNLVIGCSGNLKVVYAGPDAVNGTVTASAAEKLSVVDTSFSFSFTHNVTVGAAFLNLDGAFNLAYTLSTGYLEIDGASGTTYTIGNTPFGGEPLSVVTTGGNNHILLQGASGPTYPDTGAGDVTTVGRYGYLTGIGAPVYVLGGGQLIVDDSSDPSNAPFTIQSYAVLYGQASAPVARIYYIGSQGVTLNGGKGSTGTYQFTVQSTASGTPVNITTGAGTETNEVDVAGDSSLLTIADLGTGTDNVNIGTTQSLSPIAMVQVDGGLSTFVRVNDQNNPGTPPAAGLNFYNTATQYTITKTGLTRYPYLLGEIGGGPPTTINYSNIQSLTLNAGNNGPNAVAVEGTLYPIIINAGTSTNRIDVTPTTKDLQNLMGALTIQGGNPVLNVYDQNDPWGVAPSSPITYDVGFGVTWTSHPKYGGQVTQIAASSFAGLNLYTSSNSNVVTVNANPAPLTITSGAADTIVVKSFGPLAVDAHGGTMILDDGIIYSNIGSAGYDTYDDTFTVTDQALVRDEHMQEVIYGDPDQVTHDKGGGGNTTWNYYYISTLNYKNVTTLLINGTSVDSTFNVQSTPAGVPVTINAGSGGTHRFFVGANGSVKNIRSLLILNGNGPKDTLLVDDSQATTQDRVTVTPNQVGGAAADQFFGAGGSVNYGGKSALTLNLSRAADDTVALTSSAATAFFVNGDPSEFAAGHGAALDIDLTGVLNEQLTSTGPGAGVVTFGNRQSVTFGNLKLVQTH